MRARPNFYNEKNPHPDTEVCLELLRHSDFGFVHQVLTFTRRHSGAETTRARHFNTFLPSGIYGLLRYGGDYLSATELRDALATRRRTYYWFLTRRALGAVTGRTQGRGIEFWKYHAKFLRVLLRTKMRQDPTNLPLMPPPSRQIPPASASGETPATTAY